MGQPFRLLRIPRGRGPSSTSGIVESFVSVQAALQRRPATHVAPVMFAVQVLVPVLLAPLIFGESWSTTPLGGVALVGFMAIAIGGTTLLAGSRSVGAVIDSAHDDRRGAADGPKTSVIWTF